MPENAPDSPPKPDRSTAKHFEQRMLDNTVIAIPLLKMLGDAADDTGSPPTGRRGSRSKDRTGRPRAEAKRHEIIIDVNIEFPGGRLAARVWILENIDLAKSSLAITDARQFADMGATAGASESGGNPQYIFATLESRVIRELVNQDTTQARKAREAAAAAAKDNPGKRVPGSESFRAIHRIWPDFPVRASLTRSISTVKVDAARNSFAALGNGITWAVMDTGVDRNHPHFTELHQNLAVEDRFHRDFTVAPGEAEQPLSDENGHGTHVAGIIAGELALSTARPEIHAALQHLDQNGDRNSEVFSLPKISGMAPCCKLVSLKVLNAAADGTTRAVIRAIDHIQEINGNGREILIHGVNMSLGYEFDPEWFACGQSPLCREVNRLVKSGVVVVVAAGNTGHGKLKTDEGTSAAGMSLTINDPGNADLAITVGSTHREMPHRYGVSFFSSKGPTGDGRLKPDLVAPGEKIISCATGRFLLDDNGAPIQDVLYSEHSGTSMAAPHVSGAIAAFLSIRQEFVGETERVKEIFLRSATDLNRDRYFQGAGLVDLMRAIQSV